MATDTGEVGTTWVPQSEGTCQSGGGTAMTMCDYFEESQCLGDGACEQPEECSDLATKAIATCKIPCIKGT
jgi:hypothetical protein